MLFSFIFFLVFIIVSLLLFYILRHDAPSVKKSLLPNRLQDKIIVYVSSPLFNLSEIIFSLGVEGITPKVQESLVEALCNLSDEELNLIRQRSDDLGIPRYGVAGLIAQKGWFSYIPARDGFVLAKFISACIDEANLLNGLIQQKDLSMIFSYLTKAIYGNDVYNMGAACNACIFNGNGLQLDDGAATEVGQIGTRGIPMVIFRDEYTDQFGPGASNPMPLGNASPLINQKSNDIRQSVDILKQKIKNIIKYGKKYGLNYAATVPPPPLMQYWLEVGEAVHLTRYKQKYIITDQNGIQDAKASSTDFFYENYYKNPTSTNLVKIVIRIKDKISVIEDKYKDLIAIWAGCKNPMDVSLESLKKDNNFCNPVS